MQGDSPDKGARAKGRFRGGQSTNGRGMSSSGKGLPRYKGRAARVEKGEDGKGRSSVEHRGGEERRAVSIPVATAFGYFPPAVAVPFSPAPSSSRGRRQGTRFSLTSVGRGAYVGPSQTEPP